MLVCLPTALSLPVVLQGPRRVPLQEQRVQPTDLTRLKKQSQVPHTRRLNKYAMSQMGH